MPQSVTTKPARKVAVTHQGQNPTGIGKRTSSSHTHHGPLLFSLAIFVSIAFGLISSITNLEVASPTRCSFAPPQKRKRPGVGVRRAVRVEDYCFFSSREKE